MQKIVSWNVNGIRAAHKKGLLDFVRQESPDILCLQETKAHPDQLPGELKQALGYHTSYSSAVRRGYSGVAVWSRHQPTDVRTMGLPEFDDEGRVLIIDYPAVNGSQELTVINAYFPNSQEAGKRLDYKLAFCAAMLDICNEITASGRNLVLCGDYNIAHTPIDLANPERNTENPGYLPEERAWMDSFLAAGYIDTFRLFTPDGGHYTWWSYRFGARERNIGWRIDYHCVNPSLRDRVHSSVILPEIMGSDHCPIRLELDS
ncbi:exodeoxyribonuclease III [Spirochaeta africana]|uniref:Exodeoxyribonuclease III n=1 Tax=Spirochaeta africana (strain ATCC 700263 / DSM 8902 / Z-7692) TaxID=889378 RepID=H9UK35_SPIAZ|nr:exodeoxyribonuclease III [Spirochaeta africana]AFG37878.1 exodeoxyribonuclease III [Spirochaeta africana DSM 8902]